MDSRAYFPILVCAVLIFILLSTNPSWLQGSKYGDKPKNHPDPLMTALLVAVVGAASVYFMSDMMEY